MDHLRERLLKLSADDDMYASDSESSVPAYRFSLADESRLVSARGSLVSSSSSDNGRSGGSVRNVQPSVRFSPYGPIRRRENPRVEPPVVSPTAVEEEKASASSNRSRVDNRSSRKRVRSHRWCFTLHRRSSADAGDDGAESDAGGDSRSEGETPGALRPTSEEVRSLLQCCHQLVFYTFQEEKAPDTGRRHFQGYIRLTGNREAAFVKKIFSGYEHVHIELCKGNEEQNIKYCSKEASRVDGPWEYGEKAVAGKRNDIALAKEIVSDGGGMKDVISADINSYQAIKCAELLLKYVEKPRDFKPDVRWYHGSTGSGKTRSAVEEFPDAWLSAKSLKWWEGYDAHKTVVIDDFRKDFCTFHELLRILDRYAYRVETKGGSRQLLATTIIITCPWSPSVLYKGRSDEDIGQLKRRIDSVKLFGDEVPAAEAPLPGVQGPGFSRSAHFRASVSD